MILEPFGNMHAYHFCCIFIFSFLSFAACSRAYNMDLYPTMQTYNLQINEQANSGLKCIKDQLSNMKELSFAACSQAYNMDLYPTMQTYNPQINEQANSGLKRIKDQLSYMKELSFAACSRAYNMDLCPTMQTYNL